MLNSFHLYTGLFFISMLVFIPPAAAQTVLERNISTPEQGSLMSAPPSGLADPLQGDSLLAPKDSLTASPGRAGTPDSSFVVMHKFHHREQVIVGGTVMACITLILVTMNNYNPR